MPTCVALHDMNALSQQDYPSRSSGPTRRIDADVLQYVHDTKMTTPLHDSYPSLLVEALLIVVNVLVDMELCWSSDPRG